MATLIVPVDVAALCVGNPDAGAQEQGGTPLADFSVLPYVGGANSDGPYISADVLARSGAFDGAEPLLAGIHLHWALPAGLTRGVQGTGGLQDFPAVPERWLVTRIVVDTATAGQPQVSTRSWVIESDRLSATPTSVPGLIQPTVPLEPAPGQNFRYLGQSFDLSGWQEAGDSAERIEPLTALGYGEPVFAGYYPSSCTSFGFYDPLTDLAGYQPATSTVSYHVGGWYGDSASDPLSGGDVVTGSNRYGWTWTGDEAPTATVCSGIAAGIAWDPGNAYLGDTPQPLTVAVADTGPEALSALMASALSSDAASAGDIEYLLNALQFGLLASSGQADSQAALVAAMHDAGFAAISAGSVWSVVTPSGGGSGGDDGDGDEVTLPDALAADLNALNVLQLQADALVQELRALRQQLFADWYKYLLVRYEPGEVPTDLQGSEAVSAVQAYLDAQAQAITASSATLDALSVSISAAAAAITAQLPATLALSSQTAAPPYREPTDPVLVLSGADVTPAQRHRAPGARPPGARPPDGGLDCRLDDQVVTGLTLAAGAVTGSAQASVPATALPGLAALPGQAPASLLQALLREAIMFAPPLQPAVAAACAAQGGTANPAVLDFAATIAVLQQAAGQFLAAAVPPDVTYDGTAPDATLLSQWAGTPWLPLMLQYEVAFCPVQYIDPETGGSYAPGFIDTSFRLPPGGIDLCYEGGEPQDLQLYTGSVVLTDGAVADMAGEIARFLSNTGNTDAELTAVAHLLGSLPLLAQRLTGVAQAMLMRSLVLQLPVSDPLASPPLLPFVTEIAAAVADENSLGPLPLESFNPLRAGTLTLQRLRLVDAFGRFKDYSEPQVVLSSALTPPAPLNLPAGTAFLPPRITQPSRLLFRWLAASDDDVETNSHPTTTPVIGWLVPSWLDRAMAVYNAAGTALGELALSADGSAVLWTPAPGGAFPPSASIETVFAGQNQHLRDFATSVYAGGDATFLMPFFSAVREALDVTLPAAFRENAETAVLAGQPLALARAGLCLEVAGGTVASQSWQNFAARVFQGASLDDAGLSGVEFPVRLGDPQRLDDSLIGFWPQRDGATDWLTFYAPGATQAQGGVAPPAQDTITLSPQPQGDTAVAATLLLDPRGSVHAVSGVQPVAEIAIPPDQYAAAIASLSLALSAHPVLSAANQAAMSLALPKVSGGQWSWVAVGAGQWQASGAGDAPSSATLDYTPQQIAEGWLVLQPGGSQEQVQGQEGRP